MNLAEYVSYDALGLADPDAPFRGVPLGSQLGGAKNADGLLFALAAQIEEAAPWSGRRPPVHVAHP